MVRDYIDRKGIMQNVFGDVVCQIFYSGDIFEYLALSFQTVSLDTLLLFYIFQTDSN